MKLKIITLISSCLFLGIGCGVDQETNAGKYKRERDARAAQNAAANAQPAAPVPQANQTPNTPPPPPPPVVDPVDQAAALKAQGKQIYDGQCMVCHMPAAQTTLDTRDAAMIAASNMLDPHVNAGIDANFPDQTMAQAIIAYLMDPT